jgi:UDP-N-acetylmuramoyl-tripeptide--D-alanyl-D-alanine ligase
VRLTLAEVAEATGGSLAAGSAGAALTSVSVDTRTLAPGALFVALVGERDGHAFVPEAFARGAAAALVSEPPPPGLPRGAGVVVVADTAAALTALGRQARRRLEGVPVVGITGSTGKTSTKDLAAAALASRAPVCASPASFNNEIGLPLTLLSAPEDVGAVVAEMGARGFGHIAALAEVARPQVGVITNIGVAHTEFFGTRAEVARAKGELLEALPSSGHAVLSADCDLAPELARRSPAPVLRAGLDAGADVHVSDLALDGELRPSFRLDTPWGPAQVRLPLRGAHQAVNAAMALAVAGLLGVAPEAAAAGLAGATGSPWRMELVHTPGGLILLNDAYNANPASMAAALAALRALDGGGSRWAVLGQMAELGAVSESEHRRVGRLAADAGVTGVVVVGAGADALAEGAREAGVEVMEAAGPEAAVAALAGRLRPGDAVLVKASRVVGLEQVAGALARWERSGDDCR